MLTATAVRTILWFSLVGLVGCGASVGSEQALPSDAAVEHDAHRVQVDVDAELPVDTGGAETPPAKCTLTDVAAKQKVTFAITNRSSVDRWIVLRGAFCTPFSIDGLNLELGWECGCECPNPGSPRVDTYRRIAAGATYELTWDARRLVTCEETRDCSTWGPTASSVKTIRGAHEPAASGTHKATIAFEETVPRCTISGDEATCPWSYGGGTSALPRPIASRCESTKTANVSFTLPTTGDVLVPVSLE